MYHEIIPNLYLGNRLSTSFSKEIGVNFIISIGSQSQDQTIENLHIGLRDDNTLNISKELDQITALIDNLLENNKTILVHCKAGINRSPSFVLAYLCKYKNMSIDDGLIFILNKRKICKFAFKEHVRQWLN